MALHPVSGELYLVHGLNFDRDETIDDVTIVPNLINQTSKRVILMPGEYRESFLEQYPEEQQAVEQYEYRQQGRLPTSRMGHKAFFINETEILLIGGNSLQIYEIFPVLVFPRVPLYIFNITTKHWRQVDVGDEHNNCLRRTHFSAIQIRHKIFLTGGQKNNVYSKKGRF